jgi:4'-phosphopantetheinyl transferase
LSAGATAARRSAAPSRGSGVALWCVDLVAAGGALASIEKRTPRLAADDLARAASIADTTIAAERIAAYTALRILIERAASPRWRGVAFDRTPHGKPYLDGAPLRFSLSHAPGVALLALAPADPVGADIERARKLRMEPSRRALVEAAGEALAPNVGLPADPEARALQAWVRIEAFAKARGRGVGRVLTELGIMGASSLRQATPETVAARARDLLAIEPAIEVGDAACGSGLYAAVAAAPGAAEAPVHWLPGDVAGIEALLAREGAA